MAQYSSSEAIDRIVAPDDNVEIRGFVDHAPGRQVVGSAGRRLNVYKFVLNNDAGRRVMCLAWEKDIENVDGVVAKNKILHIEAAQAKAIVNQRFNLGNAAVELVIKKVTIITDCGLRIEELRPNLNIPVIAWDEIANKEGEIISVVGWIKFLFRETPHHGQESSQGFGSITNGQRKLEVRLTSMLGLLAGLEKGTEVKITGKIKFGSYLYINVDSGADVVRTGNNAMDPDLMLNITMPPTPCQRDV